MVKKFGFELLVAGQLLDRKKRMSGSGRCSDRGRSRASSRSWDAALTKRRAHRHVRDCRPLYRPAGLAARLAEVAGTIRVSTTTGGCGLNQHGAQPGLARLGEVGRGAVGVGLGKAWQGDQRSINESTWSGLKGKVRTGLAGPGKAGRGEYYEGKRDPMVSSASSPVERPGVVLGGWAGYGWARYGKGTNGPSTNHHGGGGTARSGRVGWGGAGCGMARCGVVGPGKGTNGPSTNRPMEWFGEARLGVARRCS